MKLTLEDKLIICKEPVIECESLSHVSEKRILTRLKPVLKNINICILLFCYLF